MEVLRVVCCLVLLSAFVECQGNMRGFVVSTQKQWTQNVTNPLLVSNFIENARHLDLFIGVELSAGDSCKDSYHQIYDFGPVTDGDVIYQVPSPEHSCSEFNVKVTISNSNETYFFQKDLAITVTSRRSYIFIQTDKPFYKPSDKVRIRALTLDERNLHPQDNQIVKAQITDSKNTVVGQWLNPSSKLGIYDFEFPLASDPRFGSWEFTVETTYTKKAKQFEVLKYVLPKFSLSVKSNPKYLNFAYGVNVSYKACAQYTYNKPVAGQTFFKLPDGSEHVQELDRDGCTVLSLLNYETIALGFRFSQSLEVLATVVENETGISRTVSHRTPIYKAISLKFSPFCNDYVKPGIAYRCFIQTYFDDHVKAKGVKFSIYDRNGGQLGDVVSDEDGFIPIAIPPIVSENFSYHSLRVGPERPYILFDLSKDLFLRRWISPNSSYLGIENNCDKNGFAIVEPFHLTFSLVKKVPSVNGEALFRYVVYSQGQPYKVGNFSLNFRNEDHFKVETLRSSIHEDNEVFHNYKHEREIDLKGVTGAVTFLLFTEVEGEVVADSIKFRVRYQPKHHVQVNFSTQKLQPGLETLLKIHFPGKSLCSLSIYDKSIETLSPVEYLNYEMIQKHWDVKKSSKSIKTQRSCDIDDPSNSLASVWDPRGRPTFAGSRDAFQMEDLNVLSDFEVSQEFCKPFNLEEEIIPIPFTTSTSSHSLEFSQVPLLRDFFPESWIWELFDIEEGDEGKNISLTLPHTITEWSGNGFCIGTETGLSVAPEFSITGFQPFFLSLNLPYSIIKGERAIVPLSIHSYLPACIRVELNVSHDNHLNVFKLRSNEFTLCGGVAKVVNLTIGAKKVGEANLTIHAKSHNLDENLLTDINVQDSVTHTIHVEPEGKPEEIIQSVFVCAPASGDMLLLPSSEDIVKDSIKSFVAVSGDLMASALANLENVLGLPTGCGEQIMVKFVPNIYILNYLKKSHLLTEDVGRKAVDYLKVGYQRSLRFRHADGSYSAFGELDSEGSLWLTAFVVKSLAGATEHIHVDPELFGASLNFIQNSQLNNGCFPLIGELFQRSLMGHMEHDGVVPSVAYNAYIVSSLVEAGLKVDDVSVLKGYRCLEESLADLSKNALYDNILLLYAHSLVINSRQSYKDAYNGLLTHVLAASVQSEEVFWSLERNLGVDIEMTSYVMLSLLNNNQPDFNQLLRMANWLSGKRNPKGGFYSTQDTVVALNALSKLAQHVSSPSNVGVTFTTLRKVPTFVVNSTNKLLVQKVETGNLLRRKVKYSVKGDGCVSVQAGSKLNVLTFTGDQHSISVFNVSVGLKPVRESCRQMILHVCFVYNGQEESTNMGVVVINFPTGWHGDQESLDFVLNAGVSLMNYEVDENSATFYFPEITKLETCFHFKIIQDVFVVQTKPARVEVFDYYNLTLTTFVEYVIYQKCPEPVKRKEESLPDLDLYYRFVRSAPAGCQCPVYVAEPYSEDVMHACSKKFSYWLNRTSEGHFHLISWNYPLEKEKQELKLSFEGNCSCKSTLWQNVVVSTNEMIGKNTSSSVDFLPLKGNDVVITLNQASFRNPIKSLASIKRSLACEWWSYE